MTPLQVHWNILRDSLGSYIKNWPVLVQIVGENRDALDGNIKSMNMGIKKMQRQSFCLCMSDTKPQTGFLKYG